ncbi:MAG: hypothetical protein Q9173_000409 [Seirophora scorigena]
MAPQQPTSGLGEADFAQALQELARGEQTASAMEDQLTALEQKIDALLASAEAQTASNIDDRKEMQDGDKNQVNGK